MTVPGEKELGVLVAESVQQVRSFVSRELLPLPGLSRAVRSRVKRRRGLARLGERWSAQHE